jgi:hypothetical protein
VELKGTAELPLKLTIASQPTSINVTGKAAAFANSDAVYRQLRDLGLGKTYHCENFTLSMDAGTFELKSGTITLLGTVLGSRRWRKSCRLRFRWCPAETGMTYRETSPRWFTRGPAGPRNSTTWATNKARTTRS